MSLVDLEAEWVRWDPPLVDRDVVIKSTKGSRVKIAVES